MFLKVFRIEKGVFRARVLGKEAQPSPGDQTPPLRFEITSTICSPLRFLNKIS